MSEVAGGLAPPGMMRAAGSAQPLANTSRAAFIPQQRVSINAGDASSVATPHYASDGTAVGHAKIAGKAQPGMASPPALPMSPASKQGNKAAAEMAGSPVSAKSPQSKAPPAEPETPVESLEMLMAKRDGIIAMLTTIRATLFKNDELIGETQGEQVMASGHGGSHAMQPAHMK